MGIIRKLTEHDYLRFLSNTPEGKGYTHLARIRIDDKPLTVYVSIYPEHLSPRGLVNEITGYLLATALNLPRPDYGVVIPIPMALIYQAHPIIELDNRYGDVYPAWGVSEVSGRTPKYVFNAIDDPEFLADLARWSELPDVLAFDESTGNTDRNLGNLIRRGRHDYVVIDHEDLGGGRRWLPDLLNVDGEYANNLAQLILCRSPSHPALSGMCKAAELQGQAVLHVLLEMVTWWQMLLSNEEQEAFRRFILWRVFHAQRLIRKRYQLLL